MHDCRMHTFFRFRSIYAIILPPANSILSIFVFFPLCSPALQFRLLHLKVKKIINSIIEKKKTIFPVACFW
uniref:Uncharacterized protein n=1 Tax=Anopheles quadriannulatus TaxID=34691 RepID=A0A182XT19_ANOQN